MLLGVIAWAVLGLRGPDSGTKSTVVHPASSASNVATRAASAVAAAQPKPALSTAQQERAAAAAMNALSSASAPAPGASTPASAPAVSTVSSKASSLAAASVAASAAHSVASAPATQAVAPQTTASAAAPSSTVKPKPKAPERKSAAPARTTQASTPSAGKHRQAGAVGICRAAGWYVQVGAFGKQQSIDRLARKLHGAGYTRVCVAGQDVRGLRLFYVGPYRNADAARAARDPLRKQTGTDGILRKLP